MHHPLDYFSKRVTHAYDIKVGDLVVVTQKTIGLPNDLPPNVTMHEGNTKMLNRGAIGLVVALQAPDDFPGESSELSKDIPVACWLLFGETRLLVSIRHLEKLNNPDIL